MCKKLSLNQNHFLGSKTMKPRHDDDDAHDDDDDDAHDDDIHDDDDAGYVADSINESTVDRQVGQLS